MTIAMGIVEMVGIFAMAFLLGMILRVGTDGTDGKMGLRESCCRYLP